MTTIRLTNKLKNSLITALNQHYNVANPEPLLTEETILKIKTAFENTPLQKYIKATQKLPEYKNFLNHLHFSSNMMYENQKINSKDSNITQHHLTNPYYAAIHSKDETKIHIKLSDDPNDFITINFELFNVQKMKFYYISQSQESKYRKEQTYVLHISNFVDQDVMLLKPLLLEQLQKKKEWDNKKTTYLKEFSDLLDYCSTFNQVVKIYPESIHLLDQKTRVKLQEKPKKQAREKVEFNLFEDNDVIVPAKTISLITNQSIGI